MASVVVKRVVFVSITVIVFGGISALILLGQNRFGELYNFLERKYYTEVLPKSKQINIQSQSTNYKVLPETSEFAKATVNELSIFDDKGVYVHHRSHTQNVRLRELDVVFTDEPQFWPGVGSLEGERKSSFDFSVDNTNKGTLKIWINPSLTSNPEQLSIIVNRTYFMALYIITYWETYQQGEDFSNYLNKVDDHLDQQPLDQAPLQVIN